MNPANADAIIGQWRSLHDVGREPDRIEAVDGYPRRVWCDRAGREVIEEYSITGMGHGTPLDTAGAEPHGAAGPFMLEVSISSTYHICRFWGLTASARADKQTAAKAAAAYRTLLPALNLHDRSQTRSATNPRLERLTPREENPASSVGKVIEDALRAAGLMR